MLDFQLVLPCFNEAPSLRALVERYAKSAASHGFTPETFQLLLVNNGSGDNTEEVLSQLERSELGRWFKIVTLEKNEGYGNGIWAGLKAATGMIVGWSHADEQCDPENAFIALDKLKNAASPFRTLVKGSRLGRSMEARFISRVFERIAGLVLGLKSKEINAQPKIFHRSLLSSFIDPPKTFAFDLYALYQSEKSGNEHIEFPVQFPPRPHGQSRWAFSLFSRWKTILGMILFMFRLSFREGRLAPGRSLPAQILNSPYFWAGLLVRVALMPWFSSSYLKNLFVPFIDYSIQHPFHNPWSQFPPHFFPYGSILLFSLWIPKFLGHLVFGSAALGATPLGITLMKLPLLVFDFGILLSLTTIIREFRKEILQFYWLNPLVIYISYIHGQLDVASMFFCCLAIQFLLSGRLVRSALMLAFATLCKFHIILAVPLLGFYILNSSYLKESIPRIFRWGSFFVLTTAIGFLPNWTAVHLGQATLFSPEAARVLAMNFFLGGHVVLYVCPLLLAISLGRLCLSTHLTPTGLFLGVGALFGVLLLTTSTMPGWYMWVAPAFGLFYALYVNAPRILFWGFNTFAVLYFAFTIDSPHQLSPEISGLAFTALQTLLFGNLFYMWLMAIRNEALIELRMRPLLIGIAGDSGSGKNYLTLILSNLFCTQNTVVIEGDNYHFWERGDPNWNKFTHLDPNTSNISLLRQHIGQLRKGLEVRKSIYDHQSGKFFGSRTLRPDKTVIVQGLHTFYSHDLQKELDLKIFLNPAETLRTAWKIRRDMKERGYSPDEVKRALERREQDSRKHIEPQKQFADWVLEMRPARQATIEELIASENIELSIKHIFWNDIFVSDLIQALQAAGCRVEFHYLPQGTSRVSLEVLDTPTKKMIETIIHGGLFPQLHLLTRSKRESLWLKGQSGITQLLALCFVRANLNNENADYSSVPRFNLKTLSDGLS